MVDHRDIGRVRPRDALIDDLLDSLSQPITLVLDHLEGVASRESQKLIAALAVGLPPGWRLALASRQHLPKAIAKARVQRGVLELGAADLAMSPADARVLLHGAGVDLTDDPTRALVRQTGG